MKKQPLNLKRTSDLTSDGADSEQTVISRKRLAYSIDSIIGTLSEKANSKLQQTSTCDKQDSSSEGVACSPACQSSPTSTSSKPKQSTSAAASHSNASSPIPDEDKVDDEPAPVYSQVCTPCGHSLIMSTLDCHLEGTDWPDFHPLGTEMIITKTGRRMFPVIKCSFSGICERDQKYAVYIDIIPVDNKRYRYAYHKSSWLVAGKADPPSPNRLYLHPDSPFTSDQIVKQVISFEKMKLTNNELDRNGHIILNSMHKYQPRIHLIRVNGQQSNLAVTSTTELHPNDFKTYIFKETQFTAVTAYQNQLITAKKIERNPFAKGFRDSSRLGEYDYSRESSFVEIAQREMQRWAGPGGFMLMQALQMQQQQRRAVGIFGSATPGTAWPSGLLASPTGIPLRPPFNTAAFANNPMMAAQLLQLNAAASLAANQQMNSGMLNEQIDNTTNNSEEDKAPTLTEESPDDDQAQKENDDDADVDIDGPDVNVDEPDVSDKGRLQPSVAARSVLEETVT